MIWQTMLEFLWMTISFQIDSELIPADLVKENPIS
jgi:hypothetical protein